MLQKIPSFVPHVAGPLIPRPFLIPSIFLTCLCGSVLPPGKPRAVIITSTAVYLFVQTLNVTSGSNVHDVLQATQGGLLLLHWLDFFILHSPEKEYSRINDSDKPVPQSGWEKLGWAWDLSTSMRGIGWNWKVKNIPDATIFPKWQWIRTEVTKAFGWYLAFDILWQLLLTTPYGSSTPPEILTDTIPRQIIFSWIPQIISYCALNMQYALTGPLTVALGLYSPEDWPPLMGSPKNLTTVRSYWGKFWHQMLRRTLNIPFDILTRLVPIKRGTLISRYSQLYLAFAASALIHNLGALNNSMTASHRYQIAFFLLQPFAITFEDFVIYLGKKAGVKESWKTKALGAIWTFCWFSWSLRFMAVSHYEAAIFATPVAPSIVQGALGLVRRLGMGTGGPGAWVKEL